jgi:DNA-binding transcriptional regulator YiaG
VESAAVVPKLPVIADTKGRLRVSKAQRRDILAALARSGESLPRFARRTGLKYSTLANWVQRSRRSKRSVQPPRLRLLEAVVESPQVAATGTPLILRLSGPGHLEIHEVGQVDLAVALLRALAKPC